jgi:hypothetical protein
MAARTRSIGRAVTLLPTLKSRKSHRSKKNCMQQPAIVSSFLFADPPFNFVLRFLHACVSQNWLGVLALLAH